MDANTVRNVLVVGSGVMGNSIAQVFASTGMNVVLVDVAEEVLRRAVLLIESSLNTLVDLGKISQDKIPSILSRIKTSTSLTEMAGHVDFVIEAVPEVPEIKKKVFSQLDEFCAADTVIASNTSGLDIFSLTDVKCPERLIIAHFFAPAHIIPLVEVVPGAKTSSEVISFTVRLMERAGKSPVVLNEFVPSFIVNRIQIAIASAAQEMLERGWANPEDIDRAVKLSLGIRLPIVGVVQTWDFNGLDLARDVLKTVGRDSSFFEKKIAQGHLGVKTSKGVYDYGGRSEAEILKKRDEMFIKMLDYLRNINAFEPV